ncbi:hypothetical protein AGMMS50284_6340 [Clostridia bacterium]|nr:hypothetical protein AGMMS50284_6340 [Clostridia bacterium]
MDVEIANGQSVGEKELLLLMKSNRLSHGIILESTSQQRLNEYAELLAMHTVCMAQNGEKPCGHCSGCIKAKSGNHSDVYTAQLSGKQGIISVDEIRHICSDAYIIPNEANGKVYILPQADKMQPPAQNAFLKVLEEPPQNMQFVLLCAQAQSLLATIRSRAVVFKLDNLEELDETTAKAREQAGNIAASLTEPTGYALLKAVGALPDRQYASLLLEELVLIIREALVQKCGSSAAASEQALLLKKKLSAKNLLRIIEIIATAQQRIDRNINMNLFTVWLCSTLRLIEN